MKLRAPQIPVQISVALLACWVCWAAVSWTFEPGLFLVLDEIGNLMRVPNGFDLREFHLLPQWNYNDRPVGFLIERLLYDWFGFDYARQVGFYLAIHFANLLVGLWLFTKLGVDVTLSAAAMGVYGGLSTTAQTTTYIGAIFDVACLFFLLASMVAFLSGRKIAPVLSGVFFFFALRSKEFAIVLPAVLFLLTIQFDSWRDTLRTAVRKLWPHAIILAAFVAKYLTILPQVHVTPDNPYYMHMDVATVAQSFAYYAALAFSLEDHLQPWHTYAVAAGMAAMLAYALWRRRAPILFSLAAWILFLLPVAFMPAIRTPFYVYAPQMFLILALALVLQDAIQAVVRSKAARPMVFAALAVLLLSGSIWQRQSVYFNSRTNFSLDTRRISAATAASAEDVLKLVGAGYRVYVAHGASLPWLFIAGPCAYLELAAGTEQGMCRMSGNRSELDAQFAADPSSKVLVEYDERGEVQIVVAEPGSPPPPP